MTTPQEPGDAGQSGGKEPFEPMPAAPALPEQELAPAAPVARPGSVNTAFVLWLVFAAILLIFAVVLMVLSTADIEDTLRKAAEDAGRRFTDTEIHDAAVVARWGGLVFYLLFAGLLTGFGLAMRNGKNWARITLCVLGGVAVLIALLFFFNLVVALLGLVLGAIAIVLMFRPASNQFFLRGRVQR